MQENKTDNGTLIHLFLPFQKTDHVRKNCHPQETASLSEQAGCDEMSHGATRLSAQVYPEPSHRDPCW